MGSFGLAITAGIQWLENTPGQWGGKEGPGPPDGAVGEGSLRVSGSVENTGVINAKIC